VTLTDLAMKSTIPLRICVLTLGLVLSVLGMGSFLNSHCCRAVARVEIEHKPDPGVFSDPWFIACEFEVMSSQLILSNVVKQLNLEANADHSKAGVDEAVRRLRLAIKLRVFSQDTIEISMSDKRPENASRIVNALAEAYRAHCTARGHSVRKVTFAISEAPAKF